jgi:GH15 family glucan-1,4-alpha-glucosidase
LRSAALKMLTFDKTGAVLATTTSLPETIGEVRNWDYRFCWIRDAVWLLKLYRDWETSGCRKFRYRRLVPNKTKNANHVRHWRSKELTEIILDHLWLQESKPVRIGNAAYVQSKTIFKDFDGRDSSVIRKNLRRVFLTAKSFGQSPKLLLILSKQLAKKR